MACSRRSFPVPVTLNRFAAVLDVFIFGMVVVLPPEPGSRGVQGVVCSVAVAGSGAGDSAAGVTAGAGAATVAASAGAAVTTGVSVAAGATSPFGAGASAASSSAGLIARAVLSGDSTID